MSRNRSFTLAALLAVLLPTTEIALAQQAESATGPIAVIEPVEHVEHVEPAEPRTEAEPEPEPAPKTCMGPEPTGRWAGRSSDDEWIPGLYPARERYADDMLALTFDDGPHKTRTPIALTELRRRDMHATFFLTGHAIRSTSFELVQQMVREGHTLANHGWRHDTNMAKQVSSRAELEAYITSELELTQIRVDIAMLATSAEDFKTMDREVFAGLSWLNHDRETQLRRMPSLRARHRALLERHGHAEDNRPVALTWIRPPGGNPYLGKRWSTAEREAFARVVNRMGMRMVMWSGGSGDSDTSLSPAERMDPERVAASATKAARRGGIYVAHDRIDPAALRAMLDAVARSEVEVVGLEQLRQVKLDCA